MNRRTIAILIGLMVFPALLLAQGTSPVAVTGISINPATVSPGTNVTITVNLRNGATTTYGCSGGALTVYVFKGDQDTTVNQVFSASVGVSPLPSGVTSNVPIPTQWTVPAGDVPSYRIVAWSPTCAPDEFGQRAALTLRRSCTYSATPLLKLPALKLQRRP